MAAFEDELVVARCNAFLEETDPDPEDPVLAARVAEAHFARADALWRLDRELESLADWEEFLVLTGKLDSDPAGLHRIRLVRALSRRRYALYLAGRGGEGDLVDAEIIRRFASDDEPEIRWWVATAMASRARMLLRTPGGVDDALSVSQAMLARLLEEPEEGLTGLCGLLLRHARDLVAVSSEGPGAVVAAVTESALNAGVLAGGALLSRLSASAFARAARLVQSSAPAVLQEHRRRRLQSLRVADTVVAVLRGSEDDEARGLSRQADVLAGAAAMQLGFLRSGSARIGEMTTGDDPAAVRAFSALAAAESRGSASHNRIGVIAFVAMRTRALAGERGRVAQIAYDDAIGVHLPAELSRPVRWAVRLMRPRGD